MIVKPPAHGRRSTPKKSPPTALTAATASALAAGGAAPMRRWKPPRLMFVRQSPGGGWQPAGVFVRPPVAGRGDADLGADDHPARDDDAQIVAGGRDELLHD